MCEKYLQKLLERTTETPEGCLEWTGCLNSDGYARVNYKGNVNGKAHRIVYHLSTGEDPEGKVVRHTCDNPKCINPSHLLIGTPADNMADRDGRGRHGQAKLSHQQVRLIRRLAGTYSNVCLAGVFGVDHRTISSIVHRIH